MTSYPCWRLSGFRKIAHYIYDDGEYLRAACGTSWWMSDGISASDVTEITPKCKACAKSKRVKEAKP